MCSLFKSRSTCLSLGIGVLVFATPREGGVKSSVSTAQAEDLLARKKALLEEASRTRAASQSETASPRAAMEMSEQDRLRRAEEFRQASPDPARRAGLCSGSRGRLERRQAGTWSLIPKGVRGRRHGPLPLGRGNRREARVCGPVARSGWLSDTTRACVEGRKRARAVRKGRMAQAASGGAAGRRGGPCLLALLACQLIHPGAAGGGGGVVGGVQRKLAELAARRSADADAASKKAAFLREAEEAVRRAAVQVATRRGARAPPGSVSAWLDRCVAWSSDAHARESVSLGRCVCGASTEGSRAGWRRDRQMTSPPGRLLVEDGGEVVRRGAERRGHGVCGASSAKAAPRTRPAACGFSPPPSRGRCRSRPGLSLSRARPAEDTSAGKACQAGSGAEADAGGGATQGTGEGGASLVGES